MLTAHVKGRKHREALVHIREPKASNKRKVAEIADFANEQSELKKSKNGGYLHTIITIIWIVVLLICIFIN
jgi:hypothetical protein